MAHLFIFALIGGASLAIWDPLLKASTDLFIFWQNSNNANINELFSCIYDSIGHTQEIPSVRLLFIKPEFSRYKAHMLENQLA